MRTTMIAAMLAAAGLSGCASIVNGVNQPVSVETRLDGAPLAGASCKLSSNKGIWFVTTPGTVVVHRGFQDLAVECSKTGVTPSISATASHVKGMAFGNLLFGGVIGVAVDSGDGAAFDYPDLISVEMGGRPVAGAPIGMQAPIAIAQPVATPVVTMTAGSAASTSLDAAPAPGQRTAMSTPVLKELHYQISAESLAKAQTCASLPIATLVASGPGTETYAIPCASGNLLVARCDYGHCRSLP